MCHNSDSLFQKSEMEKTYELGSFNALVYKVVAKYVAEPDRLDERNNIPENPGLFLCS